VQQMPMMHLVPMQTQNKTQLQLVLVENKQLLLVRTKETS
jgi:hypothetical protein